MSSVRPPKLTKDVLGSAERDLGHGRAGCPLTAWRNKGVTEIYH